MQLWFARGSEVTIREQLVTQVILGILSDDLAAHAEKFCGISPIEWHG